MSAGAAVGMTLLGLALLAVLLLCVPALLAVGYETGKPVQAELRWLFLRLSLSDLKRKKKAEKPPAPPKGQEEQPPGGSHPPFTELAGTALDLLSSAGPGVRMLLRRLYIYRLRLRLVVAEGDAAETAVAYGRANAAVYGLYAAAQNLLRMARPQIEIRPDFTAEQGAASFEAHARLLPLFALAACVRIGWGFLVKTIQREKNAPEGQTAGKEQKTAKPAAHGGNPDE